MNESLKKLCVGPNDTLKEVLASLQDNPHGICMVVDAQERILGTITDGDCRRALLKEGASLELAASSVMNDHFIAVDQSFTPEQVLSLMRLNQVEQVPIVSDTNRVIDVISNRSLRGNSTKRSNSVIILAGGRGTRLGPLTRNTPKPMLPVGGIIGGTPMLEVLIRRLVAQGFENIFLSINYLGHMIEEYFSEGEKFDCNICYLKEKEPLGTGGPLSLLQEDNGQPILLINGDLLTTVDFGALIDFHCSRGADITVGASSYSVQVPFGVIELGEQERIGALQEKPSFNYVVNAGVYAINYKWAKMVPSETYFSATDVVGMALAQKALVLAFLIHESWQDVGILDEYFSPQDSAEHIEG